MINATSSFMVGIAEGDRSLHQPRIRVLIPRSLTTMIGVLYKKPINSSTVPTGGKQLLPLQTIAKDPCRPTNGTVSASPLGNSPTRRNRTTLLSTLYPRSATRSSSSATSSSPTTTTCVPSDPYRRKANP